MALDEEAQAWVRAQLARRPPLTPEQAALIRRTFARSPETPSPGPEADERSR